MKKVIVVVALVLSLCMPVIADDNAKAATGKKTIGVSLFYRRDEYYKDLEAGFKAEAKKAGYTLLIQDADTDPAKQMQQIEDFVSKGVDAIALSCTDPAGLVPAIEAAVAKGIPVFTFDGPSNSKKVITHVGFDFYEDGVIVGQWAQKYINEKLGGKAKVAVIDYPQSAIVCAKRANGFADTVKKMPGVKIVARQDGKASRTDSMSVMENILISNPDVDVVYGINYDTGAGALAAIKAAKSKAIVVCNAWGVEGFKQLEANDPIMKAFATSSPAVQAADTIKAISEYFAGKTIPKDYLSHSFVLDATTIKNFNWREIVSLREN
ncbi:MAG: substrate-binding domain-containing protein [Spirochaetaceae bacterium]|nr:substrate-binding domain-containing protein [Spirochaetaceae bacterium]